MGVAAFPHDGVRTDVARIAPNTSKSLREITGCPVYSLAMALF